MPRIALALLLAPACTTTGDTGYTRSAYVDSFVLASCEFYERCGFLSELQYTSVENCVANTEESVTEQVSDDRECARWDEDAASECVAGIQTLACEDYGTNWPDACGDICSLGR